ncbi:STAS domain-containing protein [Rhodococcus rhodnii]|nr:STAS domain-containing protein [Rhodococcus rhodnii]
MSVSVSWRGDVLLMSVFGEIDLVTATQLSDSITAALGNDPRGFVVDLSGVHFLASAGMSVLMDAAEHAGRSGTRYAVVAYGAATARPMALVGVGDVLPVFDRVDDAVAACRV